MPIYEFSKFRDLKVYNVNVKSNKRCLFMFSGTWYPTFSHMINIICDYLLNHYSNVFDIYAISSKEDYLSLYHNDCVYDLLKSYCDLANDNGEIKYSSVNCFCLCMSASIITNIIHKLNKAHVINKLNVICYESPFELAKQSLSHPYKSFKVNYAYLENNKQAIFPIYCLLYAPKYTREMFEKLSSVFTKRNIIKWGNINMKTPYTLYCIYSKNDIVIDADMNKLYKMKPKRNGFKLYNFELESYLHTLILNHPYIEPKQYKLFFRHLDDIIARIIK